jgi:hypothetical protein
VLRRITTSDAAGEYLDDRDRVPHVGLGAL